MDKEIPLFLEYEKDLQTKNTSVENKLKIISKWEQRGFFFTAQKLALTYGIEYKRKLIPQSVGVHIPTLNSEGTLEKTLKSIYNQTYPITEVVITDGYSNDSTLEIAKKYNIKVFQCQGKPVGRNKALNFLKTTFICSIDADIEISPIYIETMVKLLQENPDISIVQGKVIDIPFSPINELKPLHIGRLCPYFENEPFTDRRILEITEKLINNLKFDVLHFSTNGVFLDDQTSRELLKMTKNIPFEMWFSFHGKDKQQVESIMKIPYDTALENIVRFIKLSEDYPNVIVRIRGSGSSRILQNEKPYFFSREEYLQMWQGIVRKYGIRKNLDIDSFTYHDRAGSIKRNEFNYNMIARESLDNFYCERVDRWIHFLYTGEIVLCCMDYHRETVFGNINEKSLFEIFYSKEYEELKLKSTGFIKSEKFFICKRCFSPGG